MNKKLKVGSHQLDHSTPTPLYYQISQVLERMIKERRVESGGKLPSEDRLAGLFEVSRPTINKAIGVLIEKGMLKRQRGKGTFIVKKKEVRLTLIRELISLAEGLRQENVLFNTKVLGLRKIRATAGVAKQLDLRRKEPVIYLQRLREVEDDPLLVSESYLPFRLFPGLLKEDFRKNSLYVTMERKCHVPVVRTERWLRVVKASEEDAYILRVSVGEPLIQLEGLAFSRDNVKVEYFNMRIRSDRAVLWTTLYCT